MGSLLSSMAVFVPWDRKLQRAYFWPFRSLELRDMDYISLAQQIVLDYLLILIELLTFSVRVVLGFHQVYLHVIESHNFDWLCGSAILEILNFFSINLP